MIIGERSYALILFLLLIGIVLDILQNVVLRPIKGKQMLRRLCRISSVSFPPLSRGEELAKSGFVFVGQAHKSPDASLHWAKLWRPSKVGDPFHLLVHYAATPIGWVECTISLEDSLCIVCVCVCVFVWRECPESSESSSIPRWSGNLVHHCLSLGCSSADLVPPHSLWMMTYRRVLTCCLLPWHTFLPWSVPLGPKGSSSPLDRGTQQALCQPEALRRKCKARPDEKEDLKFPQRRQIALGNGTTSVGACGAIYLAKFVSV